MTPEALQTRPREADGPGFGAALDSLVADLHRAPDRLRAWSLVVTLFGDAVAPRGGVLRIAAVQAVTGRLGVEPGALRTAMSRLARDGWLQRERRGRASFYALTEAKRAEFAAATARIYAAGPPDWDGTWELVAPTPRGTAEVAADALRAAGFGSAADGLFLRPACGGAPPAPAAAGASRFLAPPGGAEVSPALVAAAWPQELPAARFQDMIRRFAPLETALEGGAPPSPGDALAARTLLLHLWRRAVLSSPDLPAALRPEGWPGEAARALARRLYWRLTAPSEAWLDACEGGPDGPLPPQDPAAGGRFGGPPA